MKQRLQGVSSVELVFRIAEEIRRLGGSTNTSMGNSQPYQVLRNYCSSIAVDVTHTSAPIASTTAAKGIHNSSSEVSDSCIVNEATPPRDTQVNSTGTHNEKLGDTQGIVCTRWYRK